MNFTQNTLNIYNNYLFKHCNAVVPDFCTPQDSHSVRDKAHFAFVTPEASCATLNYLHKHKLMPLIFQYNFIANTFGLILSEEGERKTIISKTNFLNLIHKY